ncbi:MAG: hypothetical protein Q9207_002452 [Kuettlingeria erythrocarpa]
MDQWLDSLSEDWVSQPRSPHPEQVRRSSSALSVDSLTSNTSQSRIPRYKPRTGSNLAPQNTPPAKKGSAGLSERDRKSALKERSSSSLNIARNHDADSARSPASSGARIRPGSKRYASTGCLSSAPRNTVQHRNLLPSPTKEKEPGSTPEWKRRVLQGGFGGTGPDLFGPIGLESIFKPPTVGRSSRTSKKQTSGKKFQPVQVDEFPSSPPPFPSDSGFVERSGDTDRRRSSLLKQMDILEEVSEGGSRNILPSLDGDGSEQARDLSNNVGLTFAGSGRVEEDQNEFLSQVTLPKPTKSDGTAPAETHRVVTDLSRRPGLVVEPKTAEREAHPYNEEDGSSAAASPSQSVLGHLAIPSLPEDLSTGTDLYVANGGFVNVRRGGYSNDGSFQRRPLSPSSLPDFDASELRSPLPARGRLSPTRRKSDVSGRSPDQPHSAPVTPRQKQRTASGSNDEPRSSGSPLKLFDKYDTFTNERLIRRISKFERSTKETEEEQAGEEPRSKRQIRRKHKSRSQSSQPPAEEPLTDQRPKRRLDSFGQGQLDSYPFNADHPVDPKSRPAADVIEVHSAKGVSDTFRFEGLAFEAHDVERIDVQTEATQTTSGKRLPYSPNKESQAKRRRTLRSSEETKLEIHQHAKHTNVSSTLFKKVAMATGPVEQAVNSPPSVSRSLAGRKRKDARYDNDSQVADPRILALRQILRPRAPTPSQRGSHLGLATEANQTGELLFTDHSDGGCTPVRDLDHQTQALAGELATFTLNMAQDMNQGARKASVTTADFFNEARQIMQLIRNQGRPQSSHAITEEEEPDNGEDDLQQSRIEQSTIDEFSRPPSREGGGARELRQPVQVDARVASHLRKFEDTDDLGLALPSSVKSIHITESYNPAGSPEKSIDEEHQLKGFGTGCEAHSDPPNIRIIARPRSQTVESHRTLEQDGPLAATGSGVQSSKSQSSSSSTNRSVPTGSSRGSRGSGAKAVIAPQVVSHLLSDNMGAMTFDHSRQVWVKRRGSRKSQSAETHSRTGSDATEDLFRDIPDLSVDEHQERQRASTATVSVKIQGSASDKISNHDHATDEPYIDISPRPPTRDSAGVEITDQGSAPSKYSQFASSGPVPESRATSWGEEIPARKATDRQQQMTQPKPPMKDIRHGEEVEHEISILEGRTSETPCHVHRNQRQARVVTVAFSSPLVDQVQFARDVNDTASSDDDESELDLADSPIRDDTRLSSSIRQHTSSGYGKKTSYRKPSRRASIGFARPMSRLDEHEELTFLQTFHGPHNASMGLIVTTPLPVSRNTPMQSAFSSAQASSMGFQLSPLSEFTVHKPDDLDFHEGRRAVKHRGLLASHEVEGRLSLAVQDLVKKLTDVEPYEPYWDHIRHLDLRKRNLATLHHLDEFCGHIEHLDVSNNELDQLHGAPSWIRHLNARNNSLSNITSWAHLRNLQYLDVSGNRIQTLHGFQSLVHLRELKATDNQIESLEGILELDGLIKLTLRRNCIKSVDPRTRNLNRLTELDLRQNDLREFDLSKHLPVLERLDLSHNGLECLTISERMASLQELKLARNQLETLDVSQLPSLRVLDIDQNSISSINNVQSHERLEVLSWREQRIETPVQYQECRSVRKLNLSGNSLSTFTPISHLLNLQHLELASTGLHSLADDFGIKCPNIRELNLNFNALSEIRPLLGVVGLKRLYLTGNRISRLRRTTSVLERIGPELTELDLRHNLVTLNYHTAQQQPRSSAEQRLIIPSEIRDSDDSDDDANELLEKRMFYMLPGIEQAADERARQRLDEDTDIRRRVYELLVVLNCGKLRRLDGLSIDRRKVISKDGVWDRLKELGVVTCKAMDACELEA